jgi:acetoin utilization protein AcuB
MLAKQFIKDIIPPLKQSDTGQKALDWMEEFRISQLPIVHKHEFLGLISEEDILNMNNTSQVIGKYKLSLIRPFVFEQQHIYDVIKLIGEYKIGIVPILNEEKEYLGVITAQEIMENFSAISAIQNPGGILTIDLNIHDYTMTEIAHIIESENVSILSSYISSATDASKLELTMKLNKIDLSRVVASLVRHNYSVTASVAQREFSDDMKNRFDSFMNYLNI